MYKLWPVLIAMELPFIRVQGYSFSMLSSLPIRSIPIERTVSSMLIIFRSLKTEHEKNRLCLILTASIGLNSMKQKIVCSIELRAKKLSMMPIHELTRKLH